jgi:hypothetical protein
MQQAVPSRSAVGVALSGVCGVLMLGSSAAQAYISAGCDAANKGGLNASVTPGGGTVREVRLDQGETLTLTVTTKGKAALTVHSEGDAERVLHSGKSTAVVFVAPRTASYGFHIDADDSEGASLGARCTSITGAANERAVQDRRKAFLSQSDPDRIRIDRPAGTSKPLEAPGATTANGEIPKEVTASVSVSELLSAMNPGAKKDPGILDFWFEGKYMNYDTGSFQARESDGNFSVMYFGSKYMVGPDIMIGALAQFDQTGEALGTGNKASASGWMAGPYVSVRFGPGIMFDGRAAWGTTQNLPLGIAVDSTSAERSLLRGTVRGTRQYGGWDVTPKVGLSYVEDTPSGSPVSSSEGSQKAAGTGRLDIVPEVKRRFDINSETYIEPRVAAGGFLSFDEMSALNPGTSVVPEVQWKAEAGVALGKKDGVNWQASGGVETGAAAAQDTWSGRLQLNMPLGK